MRRAALALLVAGRVRRAALALLVAGLGTAEAAAPDPAALLREWALAYATNDGARAAAQYTPDARLWG